MPTHTLRKRVTTLSMFAILLFALGCGGGGSESVAVNAPSGGGEHDAEYDGGGGEHDAEANGGGEHDAEANGGGEHDAEANGGGEHDAEYAGGGEHDAESNGGGEHDAEYDGGDGYDPDEEEDSYDPGMEEDSYSGEGESDEEMYGDGYNSDEEEDSYDADMYGEDGYEGESGYGQGRQETPKTLLDWANQSFRQGKDGEAHQYLAAHALTTDPEQAKAVLDKMGWLTPASKSVMSVRCGVGVAGRAPRNFGGNFYPVGTSQNMAQGRGDGGGGYGNEGGGADYGGGATGGGNLSLDKCTGELGQRLLDGLQERLSRGDFGPILADLSGAGGAQPGARNNAGGGYEDQYDEDYDGGEGNVGGGYGAARNAGNKADAAPACLMPGVVLFPIGKDTEAKTLVTKAQAANLDVLIVFDVTMAQIVRTGAWKNETKIEVYDVSTGKREFSTKDINNIAVQLARTNGEAAGDNVEGELEKLFEHLETSWKLVNPVAAESLAERLQTIGQMFTDRPENPLTVMAELKMYYTRGMLPGANLMTAYQRLVGEPAAQVLATGTEADKQMAIEQWIPEAGRPKPAPVEAGS